MSIEEKMEADGRSIYVGNVSNCLCCLIHSCYFGHIVMFPLTILGMTIKSKNVIFKKKSLQIK